MISIAPSPGMPRAGSAFSTNLIAGGPSSLKKSKQTLSTELAFRESANPYAMPMNRFKLDEIEAAYDLFANQRDGVLKVAITM
ncbi:MAG: hypothetical protein EOP02_06940 [Proteobacteria bacterium]|nr:MAG: hypothetical protein EOP02_06940 [Pseudomonadota bacterium]